MTNMLVFEFIKLCFSSANNSIIATVFLLQGLFIGEAYEWRRLRARLDMLNGVPHASSFFDAYTLDAV